MTGGLVGALYQGAILNSVFVGDILATDTCGGLLGATALNLASYVNVDRNVFCGSLPPSIVVVWPLIVLPGVPT